MFFFLKSSLFYVCYGNIKHVYNSKHICFGISPSKCKNTKTDAKMGKCRKWLTFVFCMCMKMDSIIEKN